MGCRNSVARSRLPADEGCRRILVFGPCLAMLVACGGGGASGPTGVPPPHSPSLVIGSEIRFEGGDHEELASPSFVTLAGVTTPVRLDAHRGLFSPAESCTVDFGDGSGPRAAVAVPGRDSSYSNMAIKVAHCDAAHTYGQPGAYVVRITARHEGVTLFQERQLTVVSLSGDWVLHSRIPGNFETPPDRIELVHEGTQLSGRVFLDGNRRWLRDGEVSGWGQATYAAFHIALRWESFSTPYLTLFGARAEPPIEQLKADAAVYVRE